MNYPEAITVKEVGPRDGLQNEHIHVATADKVNWINLLSNTGLRYIEITSFVNPKWIPQLADAREVARLIDRKKGITYAALVPNHKGLGYALEADVDEVSVFMSASESHNKKNINKSISETLPLLKEVSEDALKAGKSVRGYLSTVFGCPYEGKVSLDAILRTADELFAMGISELSLGDTIGVADPKLVDDVLTALTRTFPADKLAVHFHNTRGTALANVLVSLEHGITTIDSSLGGLGGCPYAPGASGNLATDDLIYMLSRMGIHTGVNEQALVEAARFIQERIQRSLPSHQMQIDNGKTKITD